MADATPSGQTDAPTAAPAFVLPPELQEQTTEPVETNADAPPKTDVPEQAEADTEDRPDAERDKKGRFAKRAEKIQSQIDALVSQKHATQREVVELTNRAAKLRQELAARPSHDPNDYDATETHRVRSAVKAERVEQLESDVESAQQRATELRAATFMAKIEAAQDRIDGLSDAVNTFKALPLTPHAADIIAESPKAAEIAFHLAKNPDKAIRIYSLSPAQQGAELARIEAQLEVAPKVRKTTQAPAPVPTLGGSRSPAVKDTADMSVGELQEYLAKAIKR